MRFIDINNFIFIKRNIEDISSDNLEEENTNSDNSDEEEEDEELLKNTKLKIDELKRNNTMDRIEKGLPVSRKDWEAVEEIKQEYESYFDEESGNKVSEGMKELDEYIEEELSALTSKLANSNDSNNKHKEEITEEGNKRFKLNEGNLKDDMESKEEYLKRSCKEFIDEMPHS